ncbi:MAG TPA: hypothetical protein PLD20_07360 [Blastocatellia bacterium]|nr:hypothetical protein [Blastocatellia bacterium]HMV85948.1 hypothetical protein [Blastocatellia bacterium]HMX28817.1 hypothetical protein [Blastocatellia bacterium]HMY76525.1 hypothetical protein [Blastocatellia bacterium]HMZ17729.1 hypothetical protein [Blastocatellia bacterium]
MPFTPDPPFPKSSGDNIRSKDWNDVVTELRRLDTDKLNLTGGSLTGPLNVSGFVGIGTTTPDQPLTVSRKAAAYANLRAASPGGGALAVELLVGADQSGGIVSTMTNHDLQLRAGGNDTKMVIKAGGNVGIGELSPYAKLTIAGSLGFKNSTVPMLYIYESGGSEPERPIISHSPAFPTWGLSYRDVGDKMIFQNAGQPVLTVDLATRKVGIGTDSPAPPLQIRNLTAVSEGLTGAGAWANFGSNAYFDGAWRRIDTSKAGVNLHINADGGGQEFRFLRIEADGSNLRNIAVIGTDGSFIEGGFRAGISGQLVKLGFPSPNNRYGRDGVRGEPNLWLDATNTVFIKQGFQAVSGFDIAERFKPSGQMEAGDVVVFDERQEKVALCNREADKRAVGIVSSEPAFILGSNAEEVPIALCGRVECKVNADIAPISIGDLLTTSPTPGYAQKVLDHGTAAGAIIGKALGSLSSGKEKILVFVMAQ